MNKDKVGVVGLGTIGLKLVEYLGLKGFTVVAYNSRSIKNKETKFNAAIERKAKYDKVSLEELAPLYARVSFTEDMSLLSDCPIIVEAVPERYEIKSEIYSKLKGVAGKSAILCSTTSSLDLKKLAANFDPDRFVGLHFFNPPTKMKLIELSFLTNTPGDVRDSVFRFLRALDDKKVVEIPAIPGYVVNRLLFVYLNAAFEYYAETGVSVEDIDASMKLGTNVPMGPFELADYIGIDTCLEILTELYSSIGDSRYKPHLSLSRMVASGKCGRKSGIGFYPYVAK